jgi:single-strand DNA-binding protein
LPLSGALRRFERLSGAVDGMVPAASNGDFNMTNIVLLVGNLGADPELHSTNGGTDIALFSLGTARPKRDSEGKTFKDASGFTAKDTEWHRVTCFNGLGRVVAEHTKKGMLVSVRGRIHNCKWTDREGVERYGYEIIADDVQFLNRPGARANAENDAEVADNELD